MVYMDSEDIRRADDEVRHMIADGVAPIVDLSIFNCLDSLKPTDSVKGRIEYTIEEYNELLKMIKELPALLQT